MRRPHELQLEGGGPASPRAVSALEQKLGVSLPPSYRELVLLCDEAIPAVDCFQYEGGATAVSEFFRASDDESYPYSVGHYAKARIPGIPPAVIPIARDANDYLICLDYRRSSEPTVVLYDPSQQTLAHVAVSFDAFLAALTETLEEDEAD